MGLNSFCGRGFYFHYQLFVRTKERRVQKEDPGDEEWQSSRHQNTIIIGFSRVSYYAQINFEESVGECMDGGGGIGRKTAKWRALCLNYSVTFSAELSINNLL